MPPPRVWSPGRGPWGTNPKAGPAAKKNPNVNEMASPRQQFPSHLQPKSGWWERADATVMKGWMWRWSSGVSRCSVQSQSLLDGEDERESRESPHPRTHLHFWAPPLCGSLMCHLSDVCARRWVVGPTQSRASCPILEASLSVGGKNPQVFPEAVHFPSHKMDQLRYLMHMHAELGPASRAQVLGSHSTVFRRPALGLKTCFHELEILVILNEGPAFLFCSKPLKSCSWSCSKQDFSNLKCT